MTTCPKLEELFRRKVIAKDYRGYIVNNDGSRIPRMFNETWVSAINRLRPGVNLITRADWIDIEESEDQFADVLVYPVERSAR